MTSRQLASAAAAASLAGVAVLGLSAPASAQVYPPASGAGTISDTTVVPGQTVKVNSGSGTFTPGTGVAVAITCADVTGTVTADGTGNAPFTFTPPAGTPAGPCTVVFTGTNGRAAAKVSVPFTIVLPVAGGGGPVAGGGLPRTGSDQIVPLTITGIALVGVGASSIVAARRRRETQTPGGLA